MKAKLPTIADLASYDEIIDVRSPAEFAEDHIPGARNYPVLDDAQRARVGTIYKQVSPFEAKKIGAALISTNIGRHLEAHFLERPKGWRPLIYCWRGGLRSGSLTTVLRSIGWNAGQLEGGYKSWRRHVIDTLAELPARLDFRVLCGATGSGKTRILQAIAAQGEQVLDLETLACHKGSVLGVLPEQSQPAQKLFETRLLQTLSAFDPQRPVYVEAESRKIGSLHIPEPLIERIRHGRCLTLNASVATRVDFLLADYAYFLTRPEWLLSRLQALRGLLSNETLTRWETYIAQQAWPILVQELLEQHYDPLYRRSQGHHYSGIAQASALTCTSLDAEHLPRIAAELIARA